MITKPVCSQCGTELFLEAVMPGIAGGAVIMGGGALEVMMDRMMRSPRSCQNCQQNFCTACAAKAAKKSAKENVVFACPKCGICLGSSAVDIPTYISHPKPPSNNIESVVSSSAQRHVTPNSAAQKHVTPSSAAQKHVTPNSVAKKTPDRVNTVTEKPRATVKKPAVQEPHADKTKSKKPGFIEIFILLAGIVLPALTLLPWISFRISGKTDTNTAWEASNHFDDFRFLPYLLLSLGILSIALFLFKVLIGKKNGLVALAVIIVVIGLVSIGNILIIVASPSHVYNIVSKSLRMPYTLDKLSEPTSGLFWGLAAAIGITFAGLLTILRRRLPESIKQIASAGDISSKADPDKGKIIEQPKQKEEGNHQPVTVSTSTSNVSLESTHSEFISTLDAIHSTYPGLYSQDRKQAFQWYVQKGFPHHDYRTETGWFDSMGQLADSKGIWDEAWSAFHHALAGYLDKKAIDIPRICLRLGRAHIGRSNYDLALLYLEVAQRLSNPEKDINLIGMVLIEKAVLTSLSQKTDDYLASLELLNKYFFIPSGPGTSVGEAAASSVFRDGYTNHKWLDVSGNPIRSCLILATGYYQVSLYMNRKMDNKEGIAFNLSNYGDVWRKLGEHEKALTCWREAVTLLEDFGDASTLETVRTWMNELPPDILKTETEISEAKVKSAAAGQEAIDKTSRPELLAFYDHTTASFNLPADSVIAYENKLPNCEHPSRRLFITPDGSLVTYIAFSKNCSEADVKVFDRKEKKLIRDMLVPLPPLTAEILFRPDLGIMVTASDYRSEGNLLQIRHVDSGKKILDISLDYPALGLAISPDGKMAAAMWMNWKVFVWDLSSGELILHGSHPDYGRTIGFTPDSSRIVSLSKDWTLKVWDIVSQTCLSTREGEPDQYETYLSQDCQYAVVINNETGAVAMEVGTDNPIAAWKPEDRIAALYSAPNGSMVAWVYTDDGLKAWDVREQCYVQTLEKAFSPAIPLDGSCIAVIQAGDSIAIWEATEDLEKIGEPDADTPIKALSDENGDVRDQATVVLEKISEPDVESLIKDFSDEDNDVRNRAIESLGEIGEPAVEPLIEALKDEDKNVRLYAACALGRIKDVRAVVPLIGVLNDVHWFVRLNAADALGEIGKPAVEPLIVALEFGEKNVRDRAVYALGRIKDARAVEPLIKALKDEDSGIRLNATNALGDIKDARAVEPLTEALKDKDSNVRMWAAVALRMIGE